MNGKTAIVIGGPTASGKTSLAIQIAKHFNTGIISADSRQCYKELKIGVARPTEEQLKEVPHYFIASHSIHEPVNAASFEQYALTISAKLFKETDVIVIVGGTGLYIKAFCEGMDEIPLIDKSIRNEIIAKYAELGIGYLQNEIQDLDPLFYQQGEIQNPQRLMRALEVIKGTGNSIITYRTKAKKKRPFSIKKFAVHLPKDVLHNNINTRVNEMFKDGLLEEVRALILFQNLLALNTVGYKENFEYFSGQVTINNAIENIKKNTRQYAKRQLTWFRNDAEFKWIDPDPSKIFKTYKLILPLLAGSLGGI